MLNTPLKIGLAVFWVLAFANSVLGFPSPFSAIIAIIAALLIFIHVYDIIKYRDEIDGASGGLFYNVAMVLLFGMAHINTLDTVGSAAADTE